MQLLLALLLKQTSERGLSTDAQHKQCPLKNAKRKHALVCKALLDTYFCITKIYIWQGTKQQSTVQC